MSTERRLPTRHGDHRRRATWAVVAAALVAILAGCSSTVSGSVVMTTAAAPAGEVDLALLDPGNYPTKPRPPLGSAGDTHTGAFLEGARMGANVLGPWEVDPALVAHPQAGERPSNFALLFSVDATKAAQEHRLVAVFTSSRTDTSAEKNLVNSVMRFPSPEDAAAAATDMAAAAANAVVFGNLVPYDPLPIPRYPDTSGLTHKWDKLEKWDVQAFTAHGPYVLAQFANSTESAEAAAEVVATTLDKQGPVIDQFEPTAIDQLKDLPIDPDGLLARTLPPEKENGAIYGPVTQLHFDNEPLRSKTLFDDAHLQQVATGRVQVYQTPDNASAQKIVDGFAAESADHEMTPSAGVKGLPAAKCLIHKGSKVTGNSFYCVAAADRYTIEVSAVQELDAHQLVSAQYLMLTAKP